MKRRAVIGIDPGSVTTGWGVVAQEGARLLHVASGVIHTRADSPFSERLARIYQGLSEALSAHQPDSAAVEIIPHARHVDSALKLGHARGVALLAVVHAHIELAEYNPLEVKKAVVGYGKAEKEQVQAMVCRLLGMSLDGPLDRSDALAIAICHINTLQVTTRLGGGR